MRETRLGTIISVAVHSCVIPLLVAASFTVDNRSVKVVEVDFSLIKDQAGEHSVPEVKKEVIKTRPQIRGDGGAPKRMAKPARPARENSETLPVKEQVEPPPAPTIVTASDVEAETVIHGVAATYADATGEVTTLQLHGGTAERTSAGGQGGGWGGGKGTGQGTGQGAGTSLSEGSRDYAYIRDAVMKNIKYPDEAIKMGIEGRVVISFIVLENGIMSAIKVVTGSGCRLLDDSAREAVAITRIYRKVPYRIVVLLPITYKLHG